MKRLVILVTVSLLVHIDTRAEVPELGTALRRNSLPNNLSECSALFIIKVDSISHHLPKTALVNVIFHCLPVGLRTQVNRQLVGIGVEQRLSTRTKSMTSSE